ncbi:MAG TPA: Rne/Rng family ribonuclease [Acidimicrobiia bacterium]|nr:Rne/Rng family ribonuclease [Acidimicrobiia bacterium]
MPDELSPEATASEPRRDQTSADPPASNGPDRSSASAASGAANGDDAAAAARRRRRRGSRGGRNRRKTPAGTDTKRDDGPPPVLEGGLTDVDAADQARDDAGLTSTRDNDAKPQIGDRRPAPPSATTTSGGESGSSSGRRRRRGGRGRTRAGAATGAALTTPGDSSVDDVVRADLGLGDAVDLDDLDDEQRARRRGRTRKGRPAGRYQLLVHVRPNAHTHIALLEGRVLVEHSVSTPTDADTSIDGNIYLGRVQNVLPGMEAAFVDIGTPKNGVLYRGDVSFDKDEIEEKQPRIERLLKPGQTVVVQVTKNPIGAKGARLTQEVSLAGRFVVMVPSEPETYGISKRLPDDERKRLRRVLEGLRPPDAGLIVRTAAEGAAPEELERDVRRLREQWDQISALAARSKPARVLYREPLLALRIIREEFTKEYRGVLIDDRDLYEEVRAYIEAVTPELAERVEYYDAEAEGLPIFERFHVNEQLLKALDRKVWLPSGGSLVIERTEALTVIDVNTGKNVGSSSLEETVFRNNLEAAEEIARHLRLRDIGGIIVIDFIDMEIRKNREQVQQAFRDALARDKTRTQAFDISELGLIEMTRKRVSEGLVESMSETCPTCQGRGYLLEESLLEELQ